MSTVLALALISVFSNHPAYVSPVLNQFFFTAVRNVSVSGSF